MFGRDWTDVPPQRRDVAMVFQHFALYPHRTVRANIEYPLKVRGMDLDARKRKVDQIASLLGLRSLLDRVPRQLSGGEAQRVALARALVREPKCFLMDEPLGSLEPALRIRARAEIKRLQRELGVTTLFVTHDQEEAVSLADKLVIMRDGTVVEAGNAEELFRRPATEFTAQFLGKPPMNLFRATIVGATDSHLDLQLETDDGSALVAPVPLRGPARPGLKVLVGFRPDHVHVLKNRRAENEKSGESWYLPAKCAFVEGIEPDYVIHYETAAGSVLVRAPSRPSETTTIIELATAAGHYFDAETGIRIE